MTDKPMIPYRVTIELAIGGKGRTIQVTGETPDHRDGTASAWSDRDSTALAANALLWQSHAMATAAADASRWQQAVDLLNMPTSGRPC